MNKTLLIVILIFFIVNNSSADEMSSIIIEKLYQNGTKVCKKSGVGSYFIIDNPIKLIDISNDGIKDLIIDTSKQRCENSYSYFAGGTGGNDFIFFINPTIDVVNAWNYSVDVSNKKNRIFIKFFQNYKVIKWKYKVALKIDLHGSLCGKKGYIKCFTIQSVSEKGFKTIQSPRINSNN